MGVESENKAFNLGLVEVEAEPGKIHESMSKSYLCVFSCDKQLKK